MPNFDDSEYRHRFAAWCASTAIRSAYIGQPVGLEGTECFQLIEDSQLKEDLLAGWGTLHNSHNDFDEWHRGKREMICDLSAQPNRNTPTFTHGVAAKLINVYMKVLFLGSVQDCMSQENREKQKLIHPPVDSILLTNITIDFERVEVLAAGHDVGFLNGYPIHFDGVGEGIPWTILDSDQYEQIIRAFRHITRYHGLWTIEEYWSGHR